MLVAMWCLRSCGVLLCTGSTVTILAARQPGEQQAPKLRLKKLPDGTLDVSLRDSEAAEVAAAAAAAAAQPGGIAPGALAPKVWAWPLPLVGLQDWVPYETLLRSILAAQPLQALQRELQKGVALRLTKSSVTGVSLVHFDMELAGPVDAQAPAVMPADMLLDMDSKLQGLELGLMLLSWLAFCWGQRPMCFILTPACCQAMPCHVFVLLQPPTTKRFFLNLIQAT